MNVSNLEESAFLTSKNPVIYVVSDMFGDMAENIVKSVTSQLNINSVEIRKVAFRGNHKTIIEVISEAKQQQGIIAFTLVASKIREHLIQIATEKNVIAIDLIGPLFIKIQQLLRQAPGPNQMSDEYYRKIKAINFTIHYDDGKDPKGILEADIVLIGVSRTSKTPLSQYLAYRGLKVVNVPILPEVDPPKELFLVAAKKCFGLAIRPETLIKFRKERLKSMGLSPDGTYASLERIEKELHYFEDVVKRIGCPVVDVSDQAIEESGDFIFDMFHGKAPR
ncbi:pyruvate, water dikinase regulatory protein [Oceanobacillus polygoni]|uniref:Putative pyruvate, phosphate dikinase regulatory protein n=1 Tax=Oceanobacillus polygoni TaxID=1235259 RepID=A0A9X1CC75_9BACI|nr:pyruvate, water dikinase regulatory protein [Oceanobacillus polygoni]MBP2078474.1 regulator of PEP synthase PpsR (kinase-PPPase family) [Oceanobacillus polygoni]